MKNPSSRTSPSFAPTGGQQSRPCPLFPTLALLFLPIVAAAQPSEYAITVSAGGLERSETVVSFSFPHAIEPGAYAMENEAGDSIILQVGENNKASFVLDHLEAGASTTYSLATNSVEADARVTHDIDDNTILLRSGDRDVLSYFHGDNEPPESLDERYRRGGYIHPVYSPGGVLLTNHLNVDQHPHHSGIWSAWTNTRFQGRTPDFWNVHGDTGRVDRADSLEASWEGPVHAGFRGKHYFVDLSASPAVIALNEEWNVKLYRAPAANDYNLFDLKVTQTANTSQPLVLPEYHYGGVGFRGHVDWDDPDNMTFLTSEGLGRDGHATRVRWTHIGGLSDGELAGIAIMSHPENFRHPQTVRIHPTEPFFNYAPAQLGEMSIEPGSPYVVRYRYVTYDGEPDPDELDRLWNDFAYPPGVTVVPQ